jgi:hypothetical protein
MRKEAIIHRFKTGRRRKVPFLSLPSSTSASGTSCGPIIIIIIIMLSARPLLQGEQK